MKDLKINFTEKYSKIFIALLFLIGLIQAQAQTINVLNILDGYGTGSTARNNSGDYGYHLSGYLMPNAKAKLTNMDNFGASGIVPHTLNIIDGYGIIGSIPNLAVLNAYDIIYIGFYFNNSAFTSSEISYLLQWSKQPGKVLMLQEQAASSPISAAMGYSITNGNTNPTTVLPADTAYGTKIFSGVFGSASNISQGGSSQGYFVPGCTGIALAKNANNNATILLNTEYRDILVADIDFFSAVTGAISADSTISNDTDKAWGNLWAWAVNEVINKTVPSATVPDGTAYTDQTLPLCTGVSATIKLTGNNADVVRWETSTDGGSTWTPIADTAFTITYPNPINNQQFRAVLQNSASCPIGYSSAVTITVGCCASGNVAPTLSNATVTSQIVDLSTMVTSTPPTNTVVQWHSVANPVDNSTLVSNPVTATSTPTNYWAFYYSSNGNCYSPGAKVTIVSNNCTANATTVDLTTLPHSTVPANTQLLWYTTSTHDAGTEVSNPTAVGNGTYWPVFYSTASNCFSPVGNPVVVGIATCNAACYRPGATTGGATLDGKVGISALSRAGADNPDQWPMLRKGAWLVLEAKTKGFVPNRTAFDASNNPVGIAPANFVEGMMVYDTTNKCLKIYTNNGTAWGWYCMTTQACPD